MKTGVIFLLALKIIIEDQTARLHIVFDLPETFFPQKGMARKQAAMKTDSSTNFIVCPACDIILYDTASPISLYAAIS